MDERLQKALEFSNYSSTIANQKQQIKNRVKQILTVHYNSGVFTADQQTISFIKTMIDLGYNKLVVQDNNENPININNMNDFLETLTSSYSSAMTEYENEYAKIKKIRNLKKLQEW